VGDAGGVDFRVEQTYDADPDDVARAYTEPALYELIGEVSSLGRPEVLDRRTEGERVLLQVRYRFAGQLSYAARRALDPAKLTWVEHSTHDLAERSIAFRLVPDSYGDRFRASGTAVVAEGRGGAAGPRAARTVAGVLKVKAALVGGAVERAIVSGLRDHLGTEAGAVERFLAARR
jgi:hypothetical protein